MPTDALSIIFCRSVKGEYTGVDATHVKLDFQEVILVVVVVANFIIIFHKQYSPQKG